MGHVCCRRSGEVFIARCAPKGTIKIMAGDGRRIRWTLKTCARLAANGLTLVVPGVPEAATDLQIMEAVKAFEQVLFKRLAAKPRRKARTYLL